MPASRAMFAEFIGAFALMFVGGAAIIGTGGENLLVIACAHGLILGIMVTATMHISGGQLNPAVSVALATIRKQSWSQAGIFVVAQAIGAVAAAAILKATFPDWDAVKLGATLGSLSTGAEASVGTVLVLEFIATFFLMFAVMGTAVDVRGVGKTAAVGGFAIGLTVCADILAIGPLTGASMNPSRSFGPALVGGYWDIQWLYWVAPILGAICAAVSYRLILMEKSE